MTRTLTAIAMLTALIGAAAPALAGSKVPGASARPHVRILPLVRPTIRPRVHIPAISRHVATQLQNKHKNPGPKGPAGGLTTTGQGTNAAMLLPAVQAAREAARRSSSSSNSGDSHIDYLPVTLDNAKIKTYY
jgi:hypothetical protein